MTFPQLRDVEAAAGGTGSGGGGAEEGADMVRPTRAAARHAPRPAQEARDPTLAPARPQRLLQERSR